MLTYNIIRELLEAVKRITCGSININVHDAKVVQVEVTEKYGYYDWFVEKVSGTLSGTIKAGAKILYTVFSQSF